MFLVANAYLLVEEGWIYGSRRDSIPSVSSQTVSDWKRNTDRRETRFLAADGGAGDSSH